MSEENKCGACGSCENECDNEQDIETPQEEQEQRPAWSLKDDTEQAVAHMVNPNHRNLSNFAGIMPFPNLRGYEDPMIVSAIADVGIKSIPHRMTSKIIAMGIEIVHSAVNDLMCTGGDPLFFMNNISTAGLNPLVVKHIVQGIQVGCDYTDMDILDGNTTMAPGLYAKEWFVTVSGTCIGAVDRKNMVDGSRIEPGDILIGIPSAGLHLDGFEVVQGLIAEEKLPWFFTQEEGERLMKELESLPEEEAKKAFKKLQEDNKEAENFADPLLKPTALYRKEILALREAVDIRGMAHIKYGGLPRNVPRMVADVEHRASLTFDINVNTWTPPDIFQRIKDAGDIPDEAMWDMFNNGIGLVVCIPAEDEHAAIAALEDVYADGCANIGMVTEREEGEDAKEIVIE